MFSGIMYGFIWAVLLPFHLSVSILRYPLSPVAVELFSTDDGKHLTFPMQWMETIDNDLCGDDGWKTEHVGVENDPCSDWNRIQWLWRNGGNAFNYKYIGTENDPNMPQFEPGLTVRDDGHWLYRNYTPLEFWPFDGDKLEVFWGWHLYGNVQGLNKYVFTTRITKPDAHF